jgi:hypothetical protein
MIAEISGQDGQTMKRSLLLWGFLLTVGGFLVFRLWILAYFPESVTYFRAGRPQEFWQGLTGAQKILITGMELPTFAGIVLMVIGVVRLATRKRTAV